jgi:PAS domain-containing protein
VTVGGLRLGYILHLFQQANLAKDATISLVRTDGTLAARWPSKSETIGSPAEYWPNAGAAEGTTGRSSFDSIDRFWVRSDVGKYPLAVVVGLSTPELLSSWNWRICAIGLSLLMLSGIIATLIFRLAGELRWRMRSEDSLARQNIELNKNRQQFDAALGNMTQGLTFFDAEQKLLVSNRRYREIYHLTSDQTRAGSALEDILSHRMASGTFPDMTAADYLKRREALSRSATPYDVTDELRDECTISMHYQPLPDGGWVATHEDITERRRTARSSHYPRVWQRF